MLLGYLAMTAQDRGDLETAHRLASPQPRASTRPASPADTRSRTCTSSQADHATGLAWLDRLAADD